MTDFWFFLSTTALFDSLSTFLQIMIFIFLLSTKKPLGNALAFLTGLTLAYLICGLVFLSQTEAINKFFAQFLPSSVPDATYYGFQLVVGVLSLLVGIIFLRKSWNPQTSPLNAQMVQLLKIISPVPAFILGLAFSILGFPLSIPYLGAIEKLHTALGTTGALPGILFYNLVYISPMVLALGIYLIFRNRIENIATKLHVHSHRWGPLINYALVAFLGLLFTGDSLVFFFRGQGLLASKFFW